MKWEPWCRNSPLSSRPFEDRSRPVVFLAVVLLHCAIVIVLTREAERNLGLIVETEPLSIHFLSRSLPPHQTVGSSGHRIEAGQAAAKAKPVPAMAGVSDADDAMPPAAPTTSVPSIDWATEAQIASQNSLANAETEKRYRNLAVICYHLYE